VLTLVIGSRALVVTRIASVVLAAAVVVWALSIGFIYLVVLGGLFVAINLAGFQVERTKAPPSPLRRAWQFLGSADTGAAETEVAARTTGRVSDATRIEAAELRAWCAIAERQPVAMIVDLFKPLRLASTDRLLAASVDLLSGVAPRDLPGAFGSNRRLEVVDVAARVIVEAGALDGLVEGLLTLSPGFDVAAINWLQVGLHRSGLYAESIAVGRTAIARGGGAIAAYDLCCSLARRGDIAEALVWLERAIELGFGSPMVDTDADLDVLRDTESFRRIRAGLSLKAELGTSSTA